MGSSEISLANVASGLTCLAVRCRCFARVSPRSVENVARGFGDFDATKLIFEIGGIAPFGIFAHQFEVEGLRGRFPRNVVGMRLRMATCGTGAVRQSCATAPLAV